MEATMVNRKPGMRHAANVKETAIVTMARCPFKLPAARPSSYRASIPTDLHIVCLWSALGLTLSGLMFVTDFAAEIVQALVAAG
jgi:hypothetical protein